MWSPTRSAFAMAVHGGMFTGADAREETGVHHVEVMLIVCHAGSVPQARVLGSPRNLRMSAPGRWRHHPPWVITNAAELSHPQGVTNSILSRLVDCEAGSRPGAAKVPARPTSVVDHAKEITMTATSESQSTPVQRPAREHGPAPR